MIGAGLAVPAAAEDDGTSGCAAEYEDYSRSAEAEVAAPAEYDFTSWDISGVAKQKVTQLPEAGTYEEGHFLVKVADGVSPVASISGGAGIAEKIDMFGGITDRSELLFSVPESEEDTLSPESGKAGDWYLVNLPDGTDMLDAWNQLLKYDSVLAVEPNYIMHTQSIDDVGVFDPYEHAQGWLEEMNAPEAWGEITQNDPGSGVVVAVVDTGVDLDHPDLAGNLWSDDPDNKGTHGYDFVNDDAYPDDDNGHGTHVAGIIAAEKNETGTVGVAYGAKIMAVKVLDADGSGYNSDIISGINYAVYNGAKIINFSLGGYGYSKAYCDAIANANSQGVLVVAAAGNEGLPTAFAGSVYYGAYVTPANIPGVLTVMAMDTEAGSNGDWLASFSNYDADPCEGYEYELMAPGVDILSTYMGGGYEYLSGTSMACPTVAGAAAVMLGLGCSKAQTWNYLVNSGSLLQGITQPDGTARKYHALDLKSAVNAASKEDIYVPVISNCSVSASLQSVTVSGKTVALSSLNTSSLVFFQDSGLLSGLKLSLENLGGTSGSISVTGTVGGVAIVPASVNSLDAGGAAEVNLTLTGTPAKSAKLAVSLTITARDASGTAMDPVTVEQSLSAFDFTLPTGIDYDSANDRFKLTSTDVTVGSTTSGTIGTILCLPADLYVASRQTLKLQNCVVYEESGKKLSVANGAEAAVISAVLMGNGLFQATASDNLDIYYSYIYDAYITNANYFICNEFYGSSNSTKIVSGNGVVCSKFYGNDGLTVSADVFTKNMVNDCTNSSITSALVYENTFIENYYSSGTGQLKVYTANYQSDMSRGFTFNNVVGPMGVYLSSATNTPAYIYSVYYQAVESGDHNALPVGVSDSITCSSSSYVFYDPVMAQRIGFAEATPAFVTSSNILTSYVEDGKWVFGIEFNFNTAISPYSSLSFLDEEEPLREGLDVSSSTRFAGDYKSCMVVGSIDLSDLDITRYFKLSGYFTADYTVDYSDDPVTYVYDYTAIEDQSMYRFPSEFVYYEELEGLNVELDSGHLALSWSDSQYGTDYYAKISRSVNGGDFQPLTTVPNGITAYVDTDTSPGNQYEYYVYIYNADDLWEIVGAVSGIIPAAGNGMPLVTANSSQTVSTLTLGITAAENVTDCLQFDIVYDENLFDIDTITFSDKVKSLDVPYGARKTADGTVTVFIGQSGGGNIQLIGGDLLEISVSNLDTDAAQTISVENATSGGAPCGWSGPSCTFNIQAGSSKLAYNDTGSSISMWRVAGSAGSVFVSEYSAANRMLCLLAPAAGQDTDISKTTDSYTSGKSVTIIYLDVNNNPLRDCVRVNLS